MRHRKLNGQILRTVICSMLFAEALPLVLYAENALNTEDASYFCTRGMAAGLAYNPALKKWEGVQLPLEGLFSKFILRFKYMNERVRRNVVGEEEDVIDYEVTITDAETNSAFPCRSAGTGVNTKIIAVGDEQNVVCSANAYNYMFNLENNRFLSVYLHGYVDGMDSNENAPMVSGGTCAKIDKGK